MSKPRIDLSGNKFNKLMVLQWVRRPEAKIWDKTNIGFWECRCDCGNLIYVKTNALTSGRTKSCGCHREALKRQKKKSNIYDLSNEYGIGYTVNNNIEFWFDKEDFDLIKKYTWSEHNGYIKSTEYKKIILMHRLVLNITDSNIVVDHCGHNTFDNRKSKLRITKSIGNQKNKSLSKNNTSGVTGVSWEEKNKKWHSYIWVNGKTLHLGRFINFDDAVRARKEAEDKYFGEFSYDNSMKKYIGDENIYENIDIV